MLKVALIHPFSIILGLFVFNSCFSRPFQSSINKHGMMHSKRILSELSNLSFETFCDTRLVAGASDGASVRVHWPLLVSRGVWWTRGVEENIENGDRIVILPDVSYVELKNFVADIYCHHPHFGWSHLDIPQPRKLVTEEDDDCDYTVPWGAGHQGPAEAGTVPLGLVATPTPFSEPELDVLALAAAVSRDDNNNSAALETEGELPSPVSASRDCGSVPAVSVSECEVTSPVPGWGAGHQGPA